MKTAIKNGLNRIAKPLLNEVELERGTLLHHNEQVAQKALIQNYRLLAAQDPKLLPALSDIGFRKYSQYEEDGILLYIFSLLPPKNRTCVEICAGTGRECNTANLIINHGWWGHLFDGNERNVRSASRFFSNCKDTALMPPRFNQAWITAENVNDLISKSGASGEIDLLSLDIDGVDYWIWKALSIVQPRVVVCETHNPVPPNLALTVPYKADFVHQDDDFLGASLLAMVKLGWEKGYRLVGTNRYGFNAFFIRKDLIPDLLPEVTPEECSRDPFSLEAQRTRWPRVKNRRWVSV